MSSPLFGWGADRYGPRIPTVVALVLGSVALGLTIIRTSLPVFIVFEAFAGFFYTASNPPVMCDLAALANTTPGLGFGSVYALFNMSVFFALPSMGLTLPAQVFFNWCSDRPLRRRRTSESPRSREGLAAYYCHLRGVNHSSCGLLAVLHWWTLALAQARPIAPENERGRGDAATCPGRGGYRACSGPARCSVAGSRLSGFSRLLHIAFSTISDRATTTRKQTPRASRPKVVDQ